MSLTNVFVQDEGGFSNLPLQGYEFNIRNVQEKPDLLGRAAQAAWAHNALTMVALNLTTFAGSSSGREISIEYLGCSSIQTGCNPDPSAESPFCG